MTFPRRTIAREVAIEGVGLHEGQRALLRLRPAAAGTGIRFRRVDLPGTEPIPALVGAREERPRRTALVRGAAEVHTVEHVLAALAGHGVTDVDVEIDRVEVPGLDGSARDFERALLDAGLADLASEAPALRLDRVVSVEDGSGARIVASPCPGRLRLEYVLDYGALLRSRVEVEVTPERFSREIAPARTFCLAEEAEALKAAGLGRGATTGNTLVIGSDGLPHENALRFPDEYARHKLLDLLGDLALLGMRLEARVQAYKAGHALNAELVRELLKLPATEDTEVTEKGKKRDSSSVVSVSSVAEFSPSPFAFAGHFPGDPVLPGVAQIAAMRGGAAVAAIESAKFRRVVRPGEALSIERTPQGDGRLKARALVGGEVASEATFRPPEAR